MFGLVAVSEFEEGAVGRVLVALENNVRRCVCVDDVANHTTLLCERDRCAEPNTHTCVRDLLDSHLVLDGIELELLVGGFVVTPTCNVGRVLSTVPCP